MIYCPGMECEKRDNCAYHEHFTQFLPFEPIPKARVQLDESLHVIDIVDGELIYQCGDRGQYNKLQPLGWRE